MHRFSRTLVASLALFVLVSCGAEPGDGEAASAADETLSPERARWNEQLAEIVSDKPGTDKYAIARLDLYNHYLAGKEYLPDTPKTALFLAGGAAAKTWIPTGASIKTALVSLNLDGHFVSFTRTSPDDLTTEAIRLMRLQQRYEGHAKALESSIEVFRAAAEEIDDEALREESVETYTRMIQEAADQNSAAADALSGVLESDSDLLRHWDSWTQPVPGGRPVFNDDAPAELAENYEAAHRRLKDEYHPAAKAADAQLEHWNEWWTTTMRGLEDEE